MGVLTKYTGCISRRGIALQRSGLSMILNMLVTFALKKAKVTFVLSIPPPLKSLTGDGGKVIDFQKTPFESSSHNMFS